MKKNTEIQTILKHAIFLKNKPLNSLRVANGSFRRIILRQNVLRTVDLAVTGDCHYRCSFCSAYRLYKDKRPYLTVDQIKDIWRQCVKLGAVHVNLTGGEPLLRDLDELCQIIVNFNPKFFLISLVSNGLNVTKDKLRRLKRAGLDTLQLSIESTDSRIHDSMVGVPGCFDKVIEAMKYAKEMQLNICLNAVFYRDNADEIKKLIDFSKQNNVFLVINIASAEGKWKGMDKARVQQKDIDTFNGFLRYPNVRHDTSFNFSGRRECPGGKERIHITAYGDVLTCPLVQISYGNVLKESLKDIYERMVKMEHIKYHSYLCKHAFDEEYFRKLVSPMEQEEDRPMMIFNHPLYKK